MGKKYILIICAAFACLIYWAVFIFLINIGVVD